MTGKTICIIDCKIRNIFFLFVDAAAAEVFVHGCCSSLNLTAHHLTSSNPPPLVTTSIYRAEIMSQTIQNGDIKTRWRLNRITISGTDDFRTGAVPKLILPDFGNFFNHLASNVESMGGTIMEQSNFKLFFWEINFEKLTPNLS